MIVSILVFLLVLSVLVIVHELGHFIMARRAGVWVEEFGFGLPPRLFGKKIGETTWSINALPFGGFVKLHGENSEDEVTNHKRSFIDKDKKTRTGIIVAGVIMNLLLAIVAFSIVYSILGISRKTGVVKIVDIAADSPAHSSGLVVGDIVKKVDNVEIKSSEEFTELIKREKGKKMKLELGRASGEEKLTVNIVVIPRENPPEGQGPLGVTIADSEVYFPPLWQRPFYGVYYGMVDSYNTTKDVIQGLLGASQEVSQGKIPKGTVGPVGIFALLDFIRRLGVLPTINFIGILSVNLAVINLLPFPALDGGRLLFIGIEAVIGRKVLPRVESIIHTIGMIILLTLLLAITAHDIQRLIALGGISGFLNSVLK